MFHTCSGPYLFSYVRATKIYRRNLWGFTPNVTVTSDNLKWHLLTFSTSISLAHQVRSLRQNKVASTLQSLVSLAAPRHGGVSWWEMIMQWACENTSAFSVFLIFTPLKGEQIGFGALAPSISYMYVILAAEIAGLVAGQGIYRQEVVAHCGTTQNIKKINHELPCTFTVLHWI